MTQDVPKLRYKARIDFYERNLLFKTQDEMSSELNISRKTLVRDLAKWKKEGGFDHFLEREFYELYGHEKLKNPSKALDRIVMLILKRMPQTIISNPENIMVNAPWINKQSQPIITIPIKDKQNSITTIVDSAS